MASFRRKLSIWNSKWRKIWQKAEWNILLCSELVSLLQLLSLSLCLSLFSSFYLCPQRPSCVFLLSFLLMASLSASLSLSPSPSLFPSFSDPSHYGLTLCIFLSFYLFQRVALCPLYPSVNLWQNHFASDRTGHSNCFSSTTAIEFMCSMMISSFNAD